MGQADQTDHIDHIDLEHMVLTMCQAAKRAARGLATTSTQKKNEALQKAATQLRRDSQRILEANATDVEAGRENGLSSAMLDRLTLTEDRIDAMAKGLEIIIDLPDPVGETVAMWRRPNGLEIGQVRVPLGVVGIIYESRPNVTADAAGLSLKSGNAVILKGGSEAFQTNGAIVDILTVAIAEAGLPAEAIQLVRSTDRKSVALLLKQDRYVDVIIPRGGEELIRAVTAESSIPVIQHFSGLCHTYIDASADFDKAMRITMNAKTQRPWVCNAMENLLVHKDIAPQFLPPCIENLEKAGTEVRGCEQTRHIVPQVKVATDEDWVKFENKAWGKSPSVKIPAFIRASASFRSVPEASRGLGASFAHWVTALDGLYCERYDIPLSKRKRFEGRGGTPNLARCQHTPSRTLQCRDPAKSWWPSVEK